MKELHVGRVPLTLLISHEGKCYIFCSTSFTFVISFLPFTMRSGFTFSKFQKRKTSKSGILEMLPS